VGVRSKTVVFDGDDTLWETEVLYDRARVAARRVVEQGGFDGTRWDELERSIDVENVAVLGLSATRFPTSCREAYEAVCREATADPDDALAQAVYDAANTVFESPATTYPDVLSVLEELKGAWELVLLTRGDLTVQTRRVEESGVAPLLDAVCIVDEKTKATWAGLIADRGINVADSWSVGNGLRTDITPAIECGLWAAWIPAHVWEHEQHIGDEPEFPRMRTLTSIGELPHLLREHSS
jgi:putative hydrolase of the HAD superfamily